MNRYYVVGYSLLAIFVALVITGFMMSPFPFRVAVLGYGLFVLGYLIFVGIGFGAYYLARKYTPRTKAMIIGSAAGMALLYLNSYGIWLALVS